MKPLYALKTGIFTLAAGFFILAFQPNLKADCHGKQCPLKNYQHHEQSDKEIPSLCEKFCSKVDFFMRHRTELSLSEE